MTQDRNMEHDAETELGTAATVTAERERHCTATFVTILRFISRDRQCAIEDIEDVTWYDCWGAGAGAG